MTLETATGTIKLRRSDWRNWGGLFALLVALSVVIGVWRSLDPLVVTWGQQEYSHAWFILPLAALIFLQRFRCIQFGGARVPGILLAVFSVLVMLLGWGTGSYTLSVDGAIFGIIGFVWSSFGTRAMRTLGGPLVYLFFMVPLPLAIYISTSTEMQLLASQLGMALISLFGVHATLDGNVITLASAKLEVAEACSGLRYLFPLVSFAFLTAMLLEDRFWKKALLVLSSVPIAIVLNAGRIAMIAILIDRFNIDTSSGSAHAFEGFAVFALCILVLFFELWCLVRIGATRGRFVASDLMVFDSRALRRVMAWPVARPAILAGLILLIGSCCVASLPARTGVVPQRQPFALFPMNFKDWRGVPHTLDGDSLNALELTDYLLADFTRDANPGMPVNLYVAYYVSQRAGVHLHSPELCIPGGGWTFLRQSVVTLPLAGGKSIPANRIVIERRGVRQLVYYWFQERGRHIARESMRKYYGLKDALLDRRTDGALVRVVVPIVAEDEAEADSLATKMVADTSLLLEPFVPGRITQ
jgi:exosortase D (VPLPA-CTERM-specific)